MMDANEHGRLLRQLEDLTRAYAQSIVDLATAGRERDAARVEAHINYVAWEGGEAQRTILSRALDAAISERDAAVAVVRLWLRNYHDGVADAATCDRLACRQAAAVVAAAAERGR